MENLLRVERLRVDLRGGGEIIKDISFKLNKNEILGIVGESGSGKSVTSMALMRLLDERVFRIDGKVELEGLDLLTLKEREMCKFRGREIAFIYQEPQMAMNPLIRIEKQLAECLKVHEKLGKKEIKARVRDSLERVQLRDPDQVLGKYPYELSGGQLQRVMIAMALITRPKILIADEPTTALDVTVQKEIIDLIKDLSKEMGMSVLFITHDLGLVAEICERVVVMYQGEILEDAPVLDFFDRPRSDYSKMLLQARPAYL